MWFQNHLCGYGGYGDREHDHEDADEAQIDGGHRRVAIWTETHQRRLATSEHDGLDVILLL